MVTVAAAIPTIPPRYNTTLPRAVDSVLRQTRVLDQVAIYTDWDGAGAAATRNRAWQATSTDYVAFLDDDDEWLPDHIEFCLEVALATGADLVYPWFELVGWEDATDTWPDPLATMLDGQLVHPLGVPFGPEQEQHYRRYAFIPITCLVRRAALDETGGFPIPGSEEWPMADCEDWGGWLRLLDAGARFAHAPKRTWRCHLSDEAFPLGSTAGKPWNRGNDA